MIDLLILLDYYKDLKKAVNKIFPEEITWENAEQYNIKIDYRHPKWIKDFFPLIIIHYKPKLGKLRVAKKIETMYQNQNNVLTQVVWTADDFGMYNRKNSHKGFKHIVAAIRATEKDFVGIYSDRQKPKKFRNFIEFGNVHDPGNLEIKALCEILEENYPCKAIGQLRLL